MSSHCRTRRVQTLLFGLAVLGSWMLSPTLARAQTWTVLVYVAADNNLEDYAIQNILEMAEVGSGEELAIVLQVDRHLTHSDGMLPGTENFMGTRRFLVQPGYVELLEDLGVVDNTAPASLADFIAYGLTAFPSDRNALIFWDHGAGWQGCCTDENGGRHLMPLNDMRLGIEEGMVAAGATRTLDLVGFDQCLVANMEVAYSMSFYADVMVASEELEPGEGWDYRYWLQAIVDNPFIGPADLGRAIADGYRANVARMSMTSTYTLSVLDLIELTALDDAVGAFGQGLRDTLRGADGFRAVGAARERSSQFGESNKDQYGLIDLGLFAQAAAELGVGAGSAAAVLAALDRVVLYAVNGPAHRNARGISIYLPRREVDPGYRSIDFTQEGHPWIALVDDYTRGAAADISAPQIMDLSAAAMTDGARLAGTVVGDDIEDVGVALTIPEPDGSVLYLGELLTEQAGGGASGAGGALSYEWDRFWPAIGDRAQGVLVGVFGIELFEDGGRPFALVGVLADTYTSVAIHETALLLFDLDLETYDGYFLGAFALDANGAAGEIDLYSDPGAIVVPLAVYVTATGELEVTDVDSVDLEVSTLQLFAAEVPDADYALGVVATDYAGNSTIALTELSVEGTSVTPTGNPVIPGTAPPPPPTRRSSNPGGCAVSSRLPSQPDPRPLAWGLVLALWWLRRRRRRRSRRPGSPGRYRQPSMSDGAQKRPLAAPADTDRAYCLDGWRR